MLTSNELELRSTLTLGTLESNAEAIRDMVQAKLQDYSPEFYEGKAAEAKSDRAVLNAAEKQLNAKRLEIERAYMEPFNKFKATIADTCKAIKEASGKLDGIVKNEENREKQAKENEIRNYWDAQGFTLFGLEKIFSDKWLNKTAKIKDVKNEIDAAIKKALDDLKVIENFPAEDIPLVKSFYLETLDLSGATLKTNELKAARDRLAHEKSQREAIETNAALKEQAAGLAQEVKDHVKHEEMAPLVAAALEEEPAAEKVIETALIFRGTRTQLLGLKNFMTAQGITYKKLSAGDDGSYTEA